MNRAIYTVDDSAAYLNLIDALATGGEDYTVTISSMLINDRHIQVLFLIDWDTHKHEYLRLSQSTPELHFVTYEDGCYQAVLERLELSKIRELLCTHLNTEDISLAEQITRITSSYIELKASGRTHRLMYIDFCYSKLMEHVDSHDLATVLLRWYYTESHIDEL